MLSEVTSLFDLINRSKRRQAYKILTMQTAKALSSRSATFDGAVKYLEMLATTEGNCCGVINEANYQRQFVKDDFAPEPMPPPKTFEQLQKEFEALREEAIKNSRPIFTARQNPPRRTCYLPGDMTEYGWYDPEIEDELGDEMDNIGCSREEALLRIFNRDGRDNDNYTRDTRA